jgi:hypothetical protein
MSRPGLTLLLCAQAQLCEADSLVHSIGAGDIALDNQQLATDAAAAAADAAATAADAASPSPEAAEVPAEVRFALHTSHGLPLPAVAEQRLPLEMHHVEFASQNLPAILSWNNQPF